METTRPSLLLRIRDPEDDASWRTFARIYRPILLRYALARGLSQSDADDATQHVLLAVHQKITSFEYDPDKGRFKGWLRTIVNNHVRNLLRSRAAGNRAADALAEQFDDSARTPEDEFDRIWMQEHLWHCLREIRREIGERDFDVFSQLIFANEATESVCRRFDITPGHARTIKWRITRRLAQRMQDLAGEDADGREPGS